MNLKLVLISLLISLMALGCSPKTWLTADAKYVRYEVGEDKVSNAEMEELVAPYKSQLDAKMEVVIGDLEGELLKERMECSLGNWFCDAVLEEANRLSTEKVDIAIQNYGGLRVNSVSPGPITVREIYEIMPFENKLVIVVLDGEKLTELFNGMADYGGWPISKGVKYQIEDKKAVNITIDGQTIIKDKKYRLAISDYIANGGDDSSVFKSAERFDFDILIRDALITHVKRDTEMGIVQSAEKEGRVTVAN